MPFHAKQYYSRCIENECFKHENLVSFDGADPLNGGSAPGPPLGAPLPDVH